MRLEDSINSIRTPASGCGFTAPLHEIVLAELLSTAARNAAEHGMTFDRYVGIVVEHLQQSAAVAAMPRGL